jgi:hypothetical protein
MRKLILLALGGAAAAYAIKSRGAQPAPADPSPSGYAPGPEAGAEHPAAEEVEPGPEDAGAQEAATADTVETDAMGADSATETDAVEPDTSADDPLVRQQEAAAATQAGGIGGPADSATADVDPEMRPVVEGSGDDEETFEQTEDQGR